MDINVLKPVSDGRKVKSPGMKYTHYAPRAQVLIVRESWTVLWKGSMNWLKNMLLKA